MFERGILPAIGNRVAAVVESKAMLVEVGRNSLKLVEAILEGADADTIALRSVRGQRWGMCQRGVPVRCASEVCQ